MINDAHIYAGAFFFCDGLWVRAAYSVFPSFLGDDTAEGHHVYRRQPLSLALLPRHMMQRQWS